MIGAQFLYEDFKPDSDINDYRSYFLDYNTHKSEFSNSGYFEYKSKVGDIILLFVAVNGRFSLRYDYNIPDSSTEPSYYSIGNMDNINKIIDGGDENMIPFGSLLESTIAWMVITDFFDEPKQKSSTIQWINAEELDWEAEQ
ncbi:MAG: hypothetical protein ACN6ON_01095 [Sphingobacterium sp.]